ncbi:DUF805 domain-containing protein [Methylobacterium sp. J-068]|uniref:DUF805 domain-containing protein n=1 Tax=Methylobacterium sp. J-068 TaxID=2836649 RepID=UPI001FB9C658|nr:DUF805 domain-containing protein [Methylobacterium sp. J-068]MCJ2034009.1 DUF805 domain-containing protein [Methylobacterium sp. J-068]
MKQLLFSIEGRIPRSQFWLAMLIFVGVSAAVGGVGYLLGALIPGTVSPDGTMSVTGLAAIPYLALSLGYMVFNIWAGICVSAKRCHDRGRSGWFMLVQLIPLIGGIWYLIEVCCLRGTPGPNRYGPDPLDHPTPLLPIPSVV